MSDTFVILPTDAPASAAPLELTCTDCPPGGVCQLHPTETDTNWD